MKTSLLFALSIPLAALAAPQPLKEASQWIHGVPAGQACVEPLQVHQAGPGDGVAFPLMETVNRLIGGRKLGLLVAHTHGHRDHLAFDDAFRARADTTAKHCPVIEVCGNPPRHRIRRRAHRDDE